MKTYYFVYRNQEKQIRTSLAISGQTEEDARWQSQRFQFPYEKVSWWRYLVFRWLKR